MGLNHISIAVMIALFGAAPALQAETAAMPPAADTATAPVPADDPALKASPISGSTSPAQPAAGPSAPATETPSATPETAHPAKTKGDVLKVPKKRAAARKKAQAVPGNIVEDGLPGRGASMSQVENYFGKPKKKLAPVGNPPITRWIYGDYTVYFEHEYVIHSVRNEDSAQPAPAQPSAAQPAPKQPAAPAKSPAEPAVQPAAPATPPSVTTPAMPDSKESVPADAKPASGQ